MKTMGKVVVLGGNARSGKSTLAYSLTRNGFSRISFDNIYSVIEEGFGINIDEIPENRQFAFFESIIDKSIEEAEIENVNTVIDMYDFLPKDINRLKNKDKVEVYFLAYPNCTLEEIKFNIVHYAKPTDWIAQVNEKYLNSCSEKFYEKNKILVEECNQYKMNLIDTKSGRDRDIILNKLLNQIVEKEDN